MCLGQGSTLIHKQDRTTAAQGMQRLASNTQSFCSSTFWSSFLHNPNTTGGVAVLFRDGAAISDISKGGEAPGRALVVSFQHQGVSFAVACVYAPVERPLQQAFFLYTLLPLLPTNCALLVGGDFNCVSEGSDVLGGTVDSLIGRETGYWGGLQCVQAG